VSALNALLDRKAITTGSNMKTMTLCAIAFALLLLLIARGLFAGDPVMAYLAIFAAAALWASLMWNESSDPPEVEIE
jgi:hypothetical protein